MKVTKVIKQSQVELNDMVICPYCSFKNKDGSISEDGIGHKISDLELVFIGNRENKLSNYFSLNCYHTHKRLIYSLPLKGNIK